MNPRIVLAGIAGILSWNYFGTDEPLPGVPGFNLDPERLRAIWSLAIAALPIIGPKGVTIANMLRKAASVFDDKIGKDADQWGKKLEGIRELSPVLLDLLDMFRQAKAEGRSPEQLRSIRAAMSMEYDRVTRCSDEDAE